MGAPRLWTQQQAADELQVSVTTIRRLIDTGEIRAIKIGRQIRVDTASIEGYISRQHMATALPDQRKRRGMPPALQIVSGINGNLSPEEAKKIIREARKGANRRTV